MTDVPESPAGTPAPAAGTGPDADPGAVSGRRTRPSRSVVREAVLAAAYECFSERGFKAVTVAEIASRAGFSKGAVYSNFESKTELFLELQSQLADAHSGDMLDLLAGASDLDADNLVDLAARNILELTTMPIAGRLRAEVESEMGGDGVLKQKFAEARIAQLEATVQRLEEVLPAIGLTTTRPLREVVSLLDALVIGLSLEAVGVQDRPVVSQATVSAFLGRYVVPAENQPPS